MTSARLGELIDACLNGDATVRRELEAALRASSEARQAWWRAIQVHASLPGALRAHAAAKSGARMRRASSRTPRAAVPLGLRWVMVAAAALVLVAVGLLSQKSAVAMPAEAITSGLARITVGQDAGRILNSGDEVIATGPTTIALMGEATILRLESGTRLRVDRPDDSIAIVLASGTMTIDAAPQPVDHPLRVATPHAELRVIGTAFRVAVDQATDLRVDHGTVAVRSEAGEIRVGAGGEAHCRPGEAPRHGGRILRLIDDFSGGLSAWNNNSRGGLEQQLVPEGFLDGGGCRMRFLPGRAIPWPWAGMRFVTSQDWRGASGISIALRGSGNGGILLFEILDDGPPSRLGELDHAERFEVSIRDDRTGWRECRLPFTAFKRRGMQFPSAPADGLTLSAVQGLSLIHHTAPLDVVVDRIGLYRE